ncbi:MAG: type II secretion system F family protein [Phycisphaerae bacterium]|nr:type II secretion system F family protein [Phycisphaerae bacterium]
MKYSYIAYDRSGQRLAGRVEAASGAEAGELVRGKGLYPSSLTAVEAGGGSAPRRVRRRRGSLKPLSEFLRQLTVLVRTGTPIMQALEALERQAGTDAWRGVIQGVRKGVEEGRSLSEAMEAHPEVFDAVCRSLIHAGESSGRMDVLLDRLAALVRQQQQIRNAVAGAMVYPVLLVGVAGAVLCVMVLFVIPRFEGLFETLGAPLPPTTKLLISFSHGLKAQWWLWLIGLVGAVFGARAWLRSESGRQATDRALLGLPTIGRVVRSFAAARLARILGVLIDGKVPLIDALKLTRQAMTSPSFARLIDRAEDYVTKGESMSDGMSAGGLINPAVIEALRNGERTGQIPVVLLSVADYLDEDNTVLVKTLTSIIEPILLVVLGLTVGVVAFSLFMPLFDLTAAGQGGGAP